VPPAHQVDHAQLYTSNQARLASLPGWLHHYNCHRPHTALIGTERLGASLPDLPQPI
jgi:hypothetical protein